MFVEGGVASPMTAGGDVSMTVTSRIRRAFRTLRDLLTPPAPGACAHSFHTFRALHLHLFHYYCASVF